MRTFDEILRDITSANAASDADALSRLADEMDLLEGDLAHASSLNARGSALIMRSEYHEARTNLQEALQIFSRINDRSGVAAALVNLGLIEMQLGNGEEAIAKFEEASALCIEAADGTRAAIATNNIGLIHLNNAALEKALQQFRRALELFESVRHINGQATVRGNIGLVYYRNGQYAGALEEYLHALSLYEEKANKVGAGGMHVNIANVYNVTGNYPQALHHFNRALDIATDVNSRRLIVLALLNIGTVYGAMEEYDHSLENLQRALSITESFNDHASRVSCLCNIGRVHAHLGDMDMAVRSAADAVDQCLTFSDTPSLAQAVTCLAMLRAQAALYDDAEKALALYPQGISDDPAVVIERHLCRALIHAGRGQYDEAAASLRNALALSSSSGRIDDLIKAHRQFRDLAQKQGDFAAYIEHNNEIQRLTDEYNGKKTAQRISMMEAERRLEHERAERDKERALLYGALPESVAQRILRGEDVTGDHYDNASVLFLDIVGFTTIADRMQADAVVQFLDQFFSTLDAICRTHGVTKIKTIGDSYMAAAIESNTENQTTKTTHTVINAAKAAVEMLATLAERHPDIRVRIGMHVGPVTAGVLGTERLQYDVWGDTVNVASRMESHGEPGRIHVSEAFANALTPCLPDSLTLLKRGIVEIKGKGPMTTYWLEGAR